MSDLRERTSNKICTAECYYPCRYGSRFYVLSETQDKKKEKIYFHADVKNFFTIRRSFVKKRRSVHTYNVHTWIYVVEYYTFDSSFRNTTRRGVVGLGLEVYDFITGLYKWPVPRDPRGDRKRPARRSRIRLQPTPF